MKQKSLKNTVRNIVLVVLTLLLAVLTLLNVVFGLGAAVPRFPAVAGPGGAGV